MPGVVSSEACWLTTKQHKTWTPAEADVNVAEIIGTQNATSTSTLNMQRNLDVHSATARFQVEFCTAANQQELLRCDDGVSKSSERFYPTAKRQSRDQTVGDILEQLVTVAWQYQHHLAQKSLPRRRRSVVGSLL